jgi:hypothetical protein
MGVIGLMPKTPKIAACALALTAAAALGEPAVVSLARSYLGPDSTLDGITSVHFVGTLERVDSDHAADAPLRGALDVVFQKPLRQRLVVRTDKTTLTTVLDGYDAWDYLEDNADPSRFQLKWLSAGDTRTLRANTLENLFFFRGLTGAGAVEDRGPVTVDGVACERVDFNHGPGVVYERYFDRDTGRLVLTVRGEESIRENGDFMVDGVRFARTIVSVTKMPGGRDRVSTVTFTRITLNEPVAPGLFAAPSASGPGRPRPAPAAGK